MLKFRMNLNIGVIAGTCVFGSTMFELNLLPISTKGHVISEKVGGVFRHNMIGGSLMLFMGGLYCLDNERQCVVIDS